MPKPNWVPKTPKSGAGLERNQVPLSAEITCRFRPKLGAALLRFLHPLSSIRQSLRRKGSQAKRWLADPAASVEEVARRYGINRANGLSRDWARRDADRFRRLIERHDFGLRLRFRWVQQQPERRLDHV
jgi:hypothetical protein